MPEDAPRNVSIPNFTLFDIQIAIGEAEFNKGKKLFDNGKVKNLESNRHGFSATFSGTRDYTVSLHANNIDRGNCTCYLGQKDILCKHMIALAIAAVYKY